jgi:hypothetical protein
MIPAQNSAVVRRRTLLWAALLALTLALPAGGRAADVGGGCGGTWSSGAPKVCTFNFRGFPIMTSGDARVASGIARVHVWVTIEGLDGNVIYECDKSAAGYAVCDQGMVDLGETIDDRWTPYHLRCHVDGNASSAYTNSYNCKSAYGY